jgi:hypothetical protein
MVQYLRKVSTGIPSFKFLQIFNYINGFEIVLPISKNHNFRSHLVKNVVATDF